MRHPCHFPTETACGVRTATRFWVKTAIPALFWALACVFAGCGSDDDANDDKGGAGGEAGGDQAGSGGTEDSGGAGGDEPAPDAGDEPAPDAGDEPDQDGITLSWPVKEFGETLFDYDQTVEGVEVCLIESVDIPCVYTDETGVFILEGVPKNRELLLTFFKEGYLPHLVSVRTGTQDLILPAFTTQPAMVDTKRFEEGLEAQGLVVDESKGGIAFVAQTLIRTGPPSRLAISIGSATGDGPIFWNSDTSIDPEATGLSEDIPVATFHNLQDGEYIISWEAEEPEKIACVIEGSQANWFIWGLPSEEPNSIRVKVRAGFFSSVNMIRCVEVADATADAGG